MNRSELREIRLNAIVHGEQRRPNADAVIAMVEALEAVWDKLQSTDLGGLNTVECQTLADLETSVDAMKAHLDEIGNDHASELDDLEKERDSARSELDDRDRELETAQDTAEEATAMIAALRAELKAARIGKGRRRTAFQGGERPEGAPDPQTRSEGNLARKPPIP